MTNWKTIATQTGLGIRHDGLVLTDNKTGAQALEDYSQALVRETFDWIVANVGHMEDPEWQALRKHLELP